MPTAYITHLACAAHEMGAGHPEQPARLSAIDDRLRASGRYDLLSHHQAPRATNAQLERVHDPNYIKTLRSFAPAEGLIAIDPDTQMGPGSWEAALRAAGAAVLATDLVIAGDADRAFCNVRPPGHHAERARSMGFCFFNNVAVGAAHALDTHALERVAILDFDVHFGNGTADIFTGDPRVLVCSTYEYPLYPGMNPASKPGHEINCPLPAGSGGDALRAAVESEWLPALSEFRPQMLFLSAGFDGAVHDPLAGLNLRPSDYEWLTDVLCDFAKEHCENRVVSTLEGGYDLAQLAACATAHIARLMEA
jgi:acetoin utilization deacetylase AcuC-like enzyme